MTPFKISSFCVVLLLSGGAWLAATSRLDVKRAAAQLAREQRNDSIQQLRVEHQRLEAEQADLAQRERDTASAPPPPALGSVTRAEALNTLAALLKNGDISIMSASRARLGVDRDGKLAPAFTDLLQLSTDQVKELQELVTGIKRRLEELASLHATVRWINDDTIVIEARIAPEAAMLRERLRAALTQTLGADVYASFETLSRGGVDAIFKSLADEDRTITITRHPAQSDQSAPTFDLVEQQRYGRASTSGASRAIVVRQLGALGKLLPADF